MRRDCLPNGLSRAFYKYGKIVAQCPLPFLVTPVIGSLALAFGFLFINVINDVEYLTLPVNAPSRSERRHVEETFLQDDLRHYTSLRRTRLQGLVRILVKDKCGGNMYTDFHMKQLFMLDSFVRTRVKATYRKEEINYNDVCARWQGACADYENTFMSIMRNRSVDEAQLTYPTYQSAHGTLLLSYQLGGVKVNSQGVVDHIAAVLLQYNVRYDLNDITSQERSSEWTRELTAQILTYSASNLEVNIETFLSLEEEFNSLLDEIMPLFTITLMILGVFALISLLMADWVRGKPFIGAASLVGAILAGVSGMGFLMWCGVPYTPNIGAVIFLFIGIGLDDMYILVSAWRCTSCELPIEERVGQTLKHSAVSITITSVTDALAFGIGCISPFRGVQLFCAYCVMGVIFCYFYHLTFVLGCLVYDGRREHRNRHCVTFQTIEEPGNRSTCHRVLCTGRSRSNKYLHCECRKGLTEPRDVSVAISEIGSDKQLMEVKLPYISEFMSTTFAEFLMKKSVKIGVVIIYGCYLAGSVYGITLMKEGLDPINIIPDTSYYVTFLNNNYKYFGNKLFDGKSGLHVMYIYDEPLNYTDPVIRQQIDNDIERFKHNVFFKNNDKAVTSWLYDFERYLTFTSRNISSMSEGEFIHILKTEFLKIPGYSFYISDIVFGQDNNSIKASRMFVQSKSVVDVHDETNMLTVPRSIAKNSHFNAYSYHMSFSYFDQNSIILPNTLQTLGIASASMLLLALIFIPSLTSALWVAITIVSIETGVVGFMVFCNISLNSLSMINLIMCIGFSVDFAAHISYHYTISDSQNPTQCAREALGHLGTPILQSSISTILAVSVLSLSAAYVFRVFFKIVTLIMLFGSFHALFVLPVVLSSIKSCNKRCKQNQSQNKEDEGLSHDEHVGLRLSQSANPTMDTQC